MNHDNNSLMAQVDARTKLAGANRIEILIFGLGKNETTGRGEVFGVNVFKVIEVVHTPEITTVPGSVGHLRGMVSLRGTIMPVIDLAEQIGYRTSSDRGIMLVTEYNRHTQGYLVDSVENIVRLDWADIQEAPKMISGQNGLVTGIARLEDGRIIQLLDVERLLSENIGTNQDDAMIASLAPLSDGDHRRVFFADDSALARSQIAKTLDALHVPHDSAVNGARAWEFLDAMARVATDAGEPLSSRLRAIITDVEMPEMDGFMLTKRIKSDERFRGIPVLMHSSLSGKANADLGFSVGVDRFVSKFSPNELADVLIDVTKAVRAEGATQ